MMGIERKKLSMTEKDRLNTAIHESGHAVVCFFTQAAHRLYKATIVARGSSLGAVSKIPIAYFDIIIRLTWFPMKATCFPRQKRRS
jgi:ATP-dependent Zn protease